MQPPSPTSFPPYFSGSKLPTRRGYRDVRIKIPAGIRESIRSVNSEPTNCDTCKNWIPDIAAGNPKIKPYGWYKAESPPKFTAVKKLLPQCKVTLLSSSGCYVQGDLAYKYKDDDTYRIIPSNTPTEKLRFSHFTENYLTDFRQDPNCTFPIDTLKELLQDGSIGSVTNNFFSVMGACYSIKKVKQNLLPEVTKAIKLEKPDVCLIVAM